MSSFSFMSKYRTGYYLGVRSFLLRERRSVPDRISHINAEISRIGEVEVVYDKLTSADGSVRATEKRIGFSVTPESTLEKLLRAYIVQGGNPLDISMFLIPDLTEGGEEVNGATRENEKYPYGGVAYPLTTEQHATNDGPATGTLSVETQKQQEKGPAETWGDYPGGYLNIIKYPPRRLSGRLDPDQTATLNSMAFHDIRKWANAEIRYKLHDLEARIIKQCDLREQLKNELEVMLSQAWGGIFSGLKWNEETNVKDRRVSESLVALDREMFLFSSEYTPSGNNTSRMLPDPSGVNVNKWRYLDDPTENLLDLMP